ncbi:restriction endonuclease subunit S [Candidatus Viridilinea mediisalina]|uniref:Type I restriction modification DNA specificity domain-containing protein n=1 Tax=Candidatus Viridilinea mediisalina TaxID=2024553 RepID=A0A2A6RP28_9CHLR|nr:restriction endonuclease subunit S [Candidatus Viridilinea mediisalina]PDW04685.1 hypothetical protein CJ255_01965 [Candidatus Viridilinea mediisalina]
MKTDRIEKLGDYLPFSYGKSLLKSKRITTGTFPVYGSNGVIGFHNTYLTDNFTIIIGRKGTVGSVQFSKTPCWPIDTTFFISISDLYLARFAFYSIKSLGLEKMNSDSAVPGLNRDAAHARLIRIPPLPEQRAIARILGSLDDKIELNRRQNVTLEALARAVFKSWFVDFDPVRAKAAGRAPDAMDAATARLFPDGFEVVDGREVPRGWGLARLDRITENPRRSFHPSDVDPKTPYIGLEHMPRKCVALDDWGSTDTIESNKFGFDRGEILFGKLRPYFHKVGVAAISGVCSTDILVLRPTELNWFGFVLAHVSSDEFVQHTDQSSHGTKMPRTSWKDMARYQVVLPPELVASRYNDFAFPLIQSIVTNVHQSRTLAALRDALLPKLLSGELRVREAEQVVEEVL